MATPIAHKGIIAGSKVVAMTMIDLLERPELVNEAKTYFTNVQLKNNKPLPCWRIRTSRRSRSIATP